LLQNRILALDNYPREGIPGDLGYRYARLLGDSLDLVSLFDDEYGVTAANEALAELPRLTAPTEYNISRRFYRWIHPSSTLPLIEPLAMGDLAAGVAEANFDDVVEERERRLSLARFYRSELVRLEQGEEINIFPPEGGQPWLISYPVLLAESASRSGLVKRCNQAGFEVGSFSYPKPLPGLFPYYKLCRHTSRYLRGAWQVALSLLNLPLHAGVSELQAARLARALRD